MKDTYYESNTMVIKLLIVCMGLMQQKVPKHASTGATIPQSLKNLAQKLKGKHHMHSSTLKSLLTIISVSGQTVLGTVP